MWFVTFNACRTLSSMSRWTSSSRTLKRETTWFGMPSESAGFLTGCSLSVANMVLSYLQGSNGCPRNGDQKGMLVGLVAVVKHFPPTTALPTGSQLAYWPYLHKLACIVVISKW